MCVCIVRRVCVVLVLATGKVKNKSHINTIVILARVGRGGAGCERGLGGYKGANGYCLGSVGLRLG